MGSINRLIFIIFNIIADGMYRPLHNQARFGKQRGPKNSSRSNNAIFDAISARLVECVNDTLGSGKLNLLGRTFLEPNKYHTEVMPYNETKDNAGSYWLLWLLLVAAHGC